MRRGGKSARGTGRTGVLDAGIVLARLDRGHRSHLKVRQLFDQSALRRRSLLISVVNLAEVLQHAQRYSLETGVDVVAVLGAFKIGVHTPDVETARRAAALAVVPDASLADRFAAATAEGLRARLFTTDTALGEALLERKFPVTLF